MKNTFKWSWCVALALAVWLFGSGGVRAQEEWDAENEDVAEETTSDLELPAGEPEGVAPEAGGESFAPIAPSKPTATYKGADMKDAFKGSDTSRYGVKGRVNKMPGKKASRKAKGDWKRSIEAGMSTASGNSDLLRYDGSISAGKETEANAIYLEVAGRYGESDNETDAANVTGEGKYQHRLTERNYAALDLQGRHDQIADLDYRIYGSISLGRHFAWTERVVFSAELGPGYVTEKKGDDKEGFFAGRLGQYLEILLTDNLQIWESLEFVQNLEDSAVYFMNASIGLETVLVGNLNLRFALEDTYDSQPAKDKASNDITTKTTLVWKF